MSGSKLRLHKQSEKESSYREIDMLGHTKPKKCAVSTQQYNIISIVPKTIWEDIQNFSYFWFLAIIVIEFNSDIYKTSLKLSTLLPLVILLAISLIKNILIAINQHLHDKEINSRPYQVFNGIDFEVRESGGICVGDIILFKQDELVPADCVILAIDSENNELYVKRQDLPEASDLTLKKAVKETQSYVVNDEMSIGEVRLHIENLKVNHPNESFSKLSGKIRIKGNPKVTALNEQNFLIASQKILYCKWVLAIVAYSANESKIWLNFKNQRPYSLTKLEKRILIVNMIFFSVLILLTIFIGYYYYELDFQDSALDFFLNSIILYNNLIPVSFFLCIRIVEILQILRNNIKNSNIKINNPNALQDLGNIEYIITERAGILASENITIQALAIKDQVYVAQSLNEPVELTPFKESECQIDSKDALQLLPKGTASSFETLIDDLNHKEINNDQLYFIIALLLCNKNVKGFENEYINIDDSVTVKLLGELGVGYIERSDKNCEFTLAGTRYSFSIVCFQNQIPKEKQTRVMIRNNQTEEYFFFLKGCVRSMDEVIKHNTLVSEIISSNPFIELRKIIYAYKILTKKELNDFRFEYRQIKSSYLNTEGRLESLFDKNSHNALYLGAIGLENLVTQDTQQTVARLKASGCKIWIATSDSQESSVLTASTAGLITEQMSLICLNDLESHSETLSRIKKIIKNELFEQDLGDQKLSMSNHAKSENNIENIYSDSYARSENEGITLRVNSPKKIATRRASRRRSTVKTIIKSLNYDKLQSKEKPIRKHKGDIKYYAVVIDSKTLNYALQSQESRKHLAMLLFAAKSVIFHSLSPDEKIKIIKFTQNNLQFKPKVLSITTATSISDISFQADISVLVNRNLSIRSYSSINITNFSEIQRIILNLGYYHQSRVRKIFMLTLFKEFSLSILLFLYQTQSKFSAGPILDYDLLVLLELFVSLVLLILIGLNDMNIEEKELKSKPIMYVTGFLTTQYEFKIVALYIFQGIIQGILLFVFIRFGVGTIANSRGLTEDTETTGLLSFILLSCALFAKVLAESRYKVSTSISLAIGVICLIIVTALTCGNYVGYQFIANDSFVERSSLWLLICLFPLISYIGHTRWMMEIQLMLLAKLKLRSEQYTNEISSVFVDSVYWKIRMDDSLLKINKYLAKFESSDKEALFRTSLLMENLLIFKIFVSLIFIASLINMILNLTVNLGDSIDGLYSLIPFLISLSFVIATFSLVIDNIPKINMLMFFCIICYALINSKLDTNEAVILTYPVTSLFFTVSINFSFEYALVQAAVSCIISEISCALVIYKIDSTEGLYIHSFHWGVTMLGITVLLLNISYSRAILRHKEFAYIQKVEIEVERAAKILSYLLPDFIRKRVKEGARYIAEDKGTVTVIFCDLCDFEMIVDTYTPQELTGFLDDLFGRIDMLCESLGVSKIETVGKTYLACAGLKDSEDKLDQNFTAIPHARRAVEMALAILKEIEKVKLKNGSSPKFKIGINSGPVTAGVVGFHKPQFSLVGDTVNTASRMSSTLNEVNAIQISMSTYENLGTLEGLIFTDCSVEVKGKGLMDTKKVTVPLKVNEENTADELSSMISQRHSFIQAPNSPVIRTSTSKVTSENIIFPGANNRRSSLMVNLEIRNDSDILNKLQTQRVNRIINFICKESEAEKKFRFKFLKSGEHRQLVGLVTSLVVNLFLIIIEAVQIALFIEHFSLFRLLIIVFEEILTLVFLLISPKNYKKLKYSYSLAALYTIDFIAYFTAHLFSRDDILIGYMYFYLRFVQLNFSTGLLFSKVMYFNIIAIVFWLTELISWTPYASNVLSALIFILITLGTVYNFERKQRINTSLKRAAKKELEQTKQLLTQMMPPNALQNLEKEIVVTDRLNQVTLMYADIVGFTAWSSVRSPKEVVGMLSELFTRFDKMCLVYNVYKVHTIGDCYVAMGYINDNNRNPAKEAINMLKFAQSLIGVIQETNDKVKCQLGMRIGMHTGQVIGGITGTKIVRYDIYGPDVLIANKMESNGEASKITVSEATKQLIDSYMPGEYNFTESKEIRIPALSKNVKIYFVGEADGLE